ncbi:MAG: hypothetical protein QUS12_01150 [Methanosarcina sp.]|nr:hypothetical protein [Methanosarcina sp.]
MPEKARTLYHDDENRESKEAYAFISASNIRENILDGIELFDIDTENSINIVESEVINETLDSAFEEDSDDELANPIRHYIKEMGGMALLTRTGKKDIARQMEDAREEIKQVILSFPGTVKELLPHGSQEFQSGGERHYIGC